ncbi:MAG: PatB family C-S lyase [Rikenellaceae bacterium]|jgi:cystathionine beta-lyase|nr:PatB family C-S lyase [Rikenellaceae bacterium]
MVYDFDRVIDRTGTDCEKYDNCPRVFGSGDLLPLWIADMDFATPDFVLDAIRRRLEHPVLGYTFRGPGFFEAATTWLARRGGWTVQPAWIDCSPGVVPGLAYALQTVTTEGDGVVIQPPVYPPFARIIKLNDRRVVDNPLVWNGETYAIDFDDLDHKLATAKAFLMCNPHNPTGRVYSGEELRRIGDLCVKHDVYVISDEIHSDLVQKPCRHIHIASLGGEIAARTITLVAPSKTFNIAGLSTALAITPDDALRRRFRHTCSKLHLDQGNIFGTVALEAAYRQGDGWLDQMNAYTGRNMDYVVDFLHRNIPSIGCYRPESTYLLWLDFRAWRMSQEELRRFMIDKAYLGLNDGEHFGVEGIGFMRLNVASPRSVVMEAMARLLHACKTCGLA